MLEAKWPIKQALHAEIRPVSDEYSPAGHPMQLVDADAPVAVKYRPAAQGVHVTVPVTVPY